MLQSGKQIGSPGERERDFERLNALESLPHRPACKNRDRPAYSFAAAAQTSYHFFNLSVIHSITVLYL